MPVAERVATRSRPKSRFWSKVAGVLFLLVLLVAVGWFFWRNMGDRRLADMLATLDRTDPHWRIDDLQNDRMPLPTAGNNGFDQVLAARNELPRIGKWPEWPFPESAKSPARLKSLRIAMDESLRGNRFEPTVLNEEQLRVLHAEMARTGEAVAQARLLVNFPYGRAPILSFKHMFIMALPHLDDARSVVDVLKYDALLQAHDRNLTNALLDVRAILYASRALGDEPHMYSQAVRTALDSSAIASLERSLGLGAAEDGELRLVQEELLHEAKTPFYLIGMRAERALYDQFLQAVQNHDLSYREFEGYLFSTGLFEVSKNHELDRLELLIAYLSLPAHHAEMLKTLTEAVESGRAPIQERAEAWLAMNAKLKSGGAPGNLLLGRLAIPAYTRWGKGDLRINALLRAAAIGVAAERFCLANGRWPASSKELVPRYLTVAPEDPFGGEPLRWKRTGDGLIIYSLGMDGIDHDGTMNNAPFEAGSNVGFMLHDPEKRRQPANPFVRPPDPDELPK